MLVTYLVIYRADMDPNNIGIVRFARAGVNFPLLVETPLLEIQVLQLVESLWIIGPHSILTRCPRDLNISLGDIYNPIVKQF